MLNRTQEFVIDHDRSRLFTIAAGALLLMGAAMLLVRTTRPEGGLAFFVSILVMLGTVLASGITLVLSIRRLLVPERAVVITDLGFIDSASVAEAGMIRWDEIKSIHLRQWWWQSFICVQPRHLDRFLAIRPPWKQWVMQSFLQILDAPVAISGLSLPIDLGDLRQQLQQAQMGHAVEHVRDLSRLELEETPVLVRPA